MESLDFITLLPLELAIKVLLLLDNPSILEAYRVSQTWYALFKNKYLCSRLLERFDKNINGLDYAQMFKKQYRIYKNQLTAKLDVSTFDFHKSIIFTVKISNGICYSGAKDGSLILFRFDEARVVQQLQAHRIVVSCIDISDDIVATGSWDHNCKVWSLRNGSLIHQSTFFHRCPIISLKIYKSRLITGLENGKVHIWDMETKTLEFVFEFRDPLYEVSANIKRSACGIDAYNDVCWAGIGNLLVSFDLTSKDTRKIYRESATITAVTIHCNKVYTASEDNVIRVYDLDSPSEMCIAALAGHTDGVRCITAFNDFIASGGYDFTIRVWSRLTNQLLYTLPGHAGDVNAIHSDGIKIISGSGVFN